FNVITNNRSLAEKYKNKHDTGNRPLLPQEVRFAPGLFCFTFGVYAEFCHLV
ncbi:1278_t:CDS:1, partial [Cetraspora pellucida]